MDSPMASAEESKPQVLLRRKVFDGKSWGSWEDLYHRPASGCTSSNPAPFVHNFSVNTETTGRNGRKKKTKVSAGQLCIFPNLLHVSEQQQITNELLHDNESAPAGEPSSSEATARPANYFRQYQVQNQDEPRTHFLLHSQATENYDEVQPGYHYGSVRMKARPLQHFPEIHGLADQLQDLARANNMAGANEVPEGKAFWNIGVNPVLYRDGRDRIGFHADDDQGEQLIWTVLVASPSSTTRSVRIRRLLKRKKSNNKLQEDELLELFLDAGDSYSMDGLMQKFYVHSVPCDKKSVATTDAQQPMQQQGQESSAQEQQQEHQRIAIVFRRGNPCIQGRDSGRPFASLLPRVPIPYTFGNHLALKANTTTTLNGNGLTLTEAATYTRAELWEMGLHHSLQKGVSGSRQIGCDSIVVSGGRADGLGCDQLHRIVYAASWREGARALLTNSNTTDDSKPIRVFRSSVLPSEYRALANDNNTSASSKAARYRYDGLYRVDAVHYTTNTGSENNNVLYRVDDPSKHTALKSLPSDRIYLFTLVRCDLHEPIEDGINGADNSADQEQQLLQQHFHNVMTTDELVQHAIQQGSLSSKAKNLRKAQSQHSEWTALFSNVLPECNDPSKISEVPKKKATKVRQKKSVKPAKASSSKVKHKKSKKKSPSTTARKKPPSASAVAPVLPQDQDNQCGAEQLVCLASDLFSASALYNLKGSWAPQQNSNIAAFHNTMVHTFHNSEYASSVAASELDRFPRLRMEYLEAMERARVGSMVHSPWSLQHHRRPTLLDHRSQQNVTPPSVQLLPRRRSPRAAFRNTTVHTFPNSEYASSVAASELGRFPRLGMEYLEAMERARVGTMVHSPWSLQHHRRPTLLDHRPQQNVTLPSVQLLPRRRSPRLQNQEPPASEGSTTVLTAAEVPSPPEGLYHPNTSLSVVPMSGSTSGRDQQHQQRFATPTEQWSTKRQSPRLNPRICLEDNKSVQEVSPRSKRCALAVSKTTSRHSVSTRIAWPIEPREKALGKRKRQAKEVLLLPKPRRSGRFQQIGTIEHSAAEP